MGCLAYCVCFCSLSSSSSSSSETTCRSASTGCRRKQFVVASLSSSGANAPGVLLASFCRLLCRNSFVEKLSSSSLLVVPICWGSLPFLWLCSWSQCGAVPAAPAAHRCLSKIKKITIGSREIGVAMKSKPQMPSGLCCVCVWWREKLCEQQSGCAPGDAPVPLATLIAEIRLPRSSGVCTERY